MIMYVNAKLIKQLRDQRCWSQMQLAEMAGVSLRTLQRVEAKSVASQETIKCLASVLQVDCNTLLTQGPEPVERVTNTVTAPASESEQPSIAQTPTPVDKKQLLVPLLIVMLSAAIGFVGVFTAFAQQRIDEQQFTLFKDIVSIGLLIGVAGVGFKAYRSGLISKSNFY